MVTIEVPGWRSLRLEWLVLDVNGTIARDGWLQAEVRDALASLNSGLHTIAVTADTQGRAATVGDALGIELRRIEPGAEAERKAQLVEELGADGVVAIGNGANDADMLRSASLGICVMGAEGTSVEALLASDVVCRDIKEALGLISHPKRLAATLRR